MFKRKESVGWLTDVTMSGDIKSRHIRFFWSSTLKKKKKQQWSCNSEANNTPYIKKFCRIIKAKSREAGGSMVKDKASKLNM